MNRRDLFMGLMAAPLALLMPNLKNNLKFQKLCGTEPSLGQKIRTMMLRHMDKSRIKSIRVRTVREYRSVYICADTRFIDRNGDEQWYEFMIVPGVAIAETEGIRALENKVRELA